MVSFWISQPEWQEVSLSLSNGFSQDYGGWTSLWSINDVTEKRRPSLDGGKINTEIQLYLNDSRVWLGSGDNGKWTIAHLTPILKMKPYFWLCLAHEIFYTDDVTFHRCPINTCFVVWRTLWFTSYLLHSSFTSQNCIFFICSFTEKKFQKIYLHTIRH